MLPYCCWLQLHWEGFPQGLGMGLWEAHLEMCPNAFANAVYQNLQILDKQLEHLMARELY